MRSLSLTVLLAAVPSLAQFPFPFPGTPGQAETHPKIPWLDYDKIAQSGQYAVALAQGRTPNVTQVDCPRGVRKRAEWRDLTTEDKKAYLSATKCLWTAEEYGISPVSNTVFDLFVQVHQTQFSAFHGNSAFLPWHRWFTWIRHEALLQVCNYTGVYPYWNYTQDWKDPHGSPIFSSDPETGFGSHGTVVVNELGVTSYKVDNGAFANMKVNIPVPHFLSRNFSGWKQYDPTGKWGNAFGNYFGPAAVQKVMQKTTFWDVEVEVDGLKSDTGAPLSLGLHNAPHYNNVGDWNGPLWLMSTRYGGTVSTAPNDPMFFPHHAYMDSVFWAWQNLPGNQWKYNGSTNPNSLTLNNAKVTDNLPLHGLGPDVPIALALKTELYPQCYTY